jgi:hypothetical protein
MSWKDWIYEKPANGEVKQEEAKEMPTAMQGGESIKFPNSTTITVSAPVQVTVSSPACEPHLEKILELYDKGFESLNKPGYDFFEYFKAILSAGVDNASAYPMALSMAQSMDKTITRDGLVSESDFYVTEIMKVHSGYVEGGNAKKKELNDKKEAEKQQLSTDLTSLKMQLEAITNQINITQASLANIDSKYVNELTDTECKLMANDVAKDRIIASIDKVKQGLINNVK